MAEIVASPPAARSAFAGLLRAGRLGRPDGPPGVIVQERAGLSIVHVAAFRGRAAEVRDRVQDRLGLGLPGEPRHVEGGGIAAAWAGPAQWVVLSGGSRGDALEGELAAILAGSAAVTGIGDGRAVLRVAGPMARQALAKGIAIDLDPRAFPSGSTALTPASMIDVQVSLVEGGTAFEVMLFRGFAGSFWHWLEESALEYGLEVLPPAG